MIQHPPGGPGPKNNGPLCARNIDTTCPLFPPYPLTLHLSLSLYPCSCSLVLPLAGKEQGMLIKGFERQEKDGGLVGTEGADNRQRMVCVTMDSNIVEIKKKIRFVTKMGARK